MVYSYNPLGFYTVKGNRQYDNTQNPDVLHHFETNKIPAFQIVIDSVVASGSYALYDINDIQIASGSLSVTSGTDYTVLYLTGVTLTGKTDGLYYLRLSYGSTTLYSDVFCWDTDVSEFLKITATSATNMVLAGYKINPFTWVSYFETNKVTEEYEINEEGVEKSYGVIPLHVSRNHMLTYEITGYLKTFDYLAGLRVVKANGTVTTVLNGETYEIYDITLPEKKGIYGNSDILVIDLKFKVKDYLQTYNLI